MAFTTSVDTRRSRASVMRLVGEAVVSLTGGPTRYGDRLRRMFSGYYVQEMFRQIHDAYMIKSEGGTDELGEKWPPLSPSTIAYRPVTEADRQKYRIAENTTRGLLTPAEDKLWRRIFRARVQKLVAEGMHEESDAKPRAAAAAWSILKARGAKTKIGTLANRRVPILIRGGRLEESYRPGVATKSGYFPVNEDQDYQIRGTGFRYGSKVPHARFHKEGTKNMPARPPVPEPRTMRRWTLRACTRAMEQVMQRVLWDL